MEISEKNFLNIQEARAFLGVSRGFIYGKMSSNELPVFKLGRKTMLKKSDLENLIRPKEKK